MKPLKYQLKNGLTVLLAESRKSPVVSVQMWVRTGSADENPAQAGLSHFIEHLVFKGTRDFGVGEIASYVEGSGGELNAYTSFDQTVFYVTIASLRADVALKTVSQMMGHPTFDKEEIDREREVVIEEIKRGQDSPSRVSSQLMFGTAYKKHTYGRPVIGYDRIVRGVSVKAIKKYFEDRYCPRNMFLVVAGDFETKAMKQKVQEFFGDFADYPVRKVKRAKEPKMTAPRVKVEKSAFKETMTSITWKIPSIDHDDVPALDALALILGQGDSSRLTKRLRMDEPLVQSIGASAFTPQDAGLFAVSMSLDGKQIAPALKAVQEEVSRIRAEGPTAEEVSKAVVCLASDQIYSLETVDGLSRSFGSMEFYLRDPNAFPKYLKKLYALKPDEIRRIAKKYLVPKTMTVTGLTDSDLGALKKEVSVFVSSEKKNKPVSGAKKTAAKSKDKVLRLKARGMGDSKVTKTQKITLPGGGLLLLREQKETPTASLRFAFGGGVLAEPGQMDGLSELFVRSWAAGGKKYDEHSLNAAVDSMAAGFGTFAGRNTIGLSADLISDFDAKVWDILEDVFNDPTLPEEVLSREKEMLLRQIKIRKDNPSQVCMRGFMKALFGEHPYAREMGGTEESLARINNQHLKEYRQKIFGRENMSVSIVGDFSSSVWQKRIEGLMKGMRNGKSLIREVAHEAPKKDLRIFQKLDKEQTHIVLGYEGLGLKDSRKWAMQVMQAVLAGQGGRLFIELRDKNSLAYSVSPLRMEGLGTGYFGAYIGCSPDKGTIAEKMIREEFQKLVDKKIPEVELERAQNYLIGRTAIDLQKKSAVCNSILFDEIYGVDSEEGLRPEERYLGVTAEQVQSLAKEIFSRPSVLSVAGPMDI